MDEHKLVQLVKEASRVRAIHLYYFTAHVLPPFQPPSTNSFALFGFIFKRTICMVHSVARMQLRGHGCTPGKVYCLNRKITKIAYKFKVFFFPNSFLPLLFLLLPNSNARGAAWLLRPGNGGTGQTCTKRAILFSADMDCIAMTSLN